MKHLPYLLLLSLLLPLCLSGNPTERRRESFRQLQQMVDSGRPEALFAMARLLEDGNDLVDKDSLRALALYTQAADSAYPPALNYLGYIYFNGLMGQDTDPDKGLRLIEEAAMKGDLSAAANLGWLLSQKGTSVKQDTDKALYWLGKAAQSGSYLPLEAMADIYMQSGDTLRSEECLEEAVMRGSVKSAPLLLQLREEEYAAMSPDSLMQTALRYYHGSAPLMGVLLMEKILDRPDTSSHDRALTLAIRGQLMSQGYLLPYDYQQSLRLFLEAAILGNPSAQFIVAETLDLTPDAFEEYGIKEEEKLTAEEWRQLATEGGITDSRSALLPLLP